MEDSPESLDSEFEITADMLIHDTMDDESTMAQDEALQTKEEEEQELEGLQKEGDMPLEQLLSLYGYGSSQLPGPSSSAVVEARSSVAQMDSSSGNRVRRKRQRSGDVAGGFENPLPITSPDHLRVGSSAGNDGGVGGADKKEKSTAVSEGKVGVHHQGIVTVTVIEVPNSTLMNLSQGTSVRETSALTRLEEEERSVDTDQLLRTASSRGGTARELAPSEDTAEDSTDIEVVEDDGVGVGLEAGLGDVEHNLLELVQLEQDVVQIQDIEAGLGRGEGLFPPLDLMCKESLGVVGGADADVALVGEADKEMDGYEGEEGVEQWAESVGEGAIVDHWKTRESREDVGMAMTGGGEGELPLENEAVYGDVLLSSNNTAVMSQEMAVEEMQSTEAASTASAKFVRGSRLRPEIPERRSMRLMNNDDRAILNAYFASVLTDGSGSESDEEYSPQEDWKKEVNIGDEYQATIPDYAPTTPYPVSSQPPDHLVWTPRGTAGKEESEYLGAVSSSSDDSSRDHSHEKELADGKHNSQKAIKLMQKSLSSEAAPWSEDECRAFEDGLRSVGKDFFMLHRKVPSRSVRELVEFYYFWKKSQRYDHFIQKYGKIGRRKIIVSPGDVSDFMDKYLDMHSSDAVDVHYLTSTVATEARKENY